MKYGLLRWLTVSENDEAPLSLGVVSYLTPDESHNADGKHTAYLEPGNRATEQLRRLGPDLHDCLRTMVMLERSVARVERSGALPPGTRTFARPLTFADLPVVDRTSRLERRRQWLGEALSAVQGSDVVLST